MLGFSPTSILRAHGTLENVSWKLLQGPAFDFLPHFYMPVFSFLEESMSQILNSKALNLVSK